MSRRVRSFPVTPRVTLRPDERAQRWLLGVSASDRSGLLYAISRVLARHDINLQLAKITTLGERVEDTFLIDGSALQQNKMQLQIESEMLDAIAPDMAPAAPTPMRSTDHVQPKAHRRSRTASTPSSTRARRASSPRTGCPARSTGRRSTTPSARSSAPSTSRSRRSRRGSAAPRWSRATSRRTSSATSLDKPHDWTPLVYCWRGGKRSGALATVLDQIGFRVHVLEGGYRAFRRAVVAALDELPARFDWRVVCGPTGSGKSRLLAALAAQGAQVLDLEALANHRGSVLGLVPGSPQPTQKAFDTLVWDALRRLDPARPVFVESESKKIGELRVPEALIERMRASPCLWLELPIERRVALLLDEYDFFVADVDAFCARLDALRALRGNDDVDAWQDAARRGRTGRGRARSPRCALRPDLPRVDAAQLRRRRSPLLIAALGRQRRRGCAAAAALATAHRFSARKSETTASDRSEAVVPGRAHQAARRRLATKPIMPRPARSSA